MKNSESGLIKVTEHLCSVFRKALPAYSCSKSKHTYKQHQLAVIWCLMKYLRTDYRRVVGLLGLMPAMKRVIGLERLPHFTTVNKFFLRMSTSFAHDVLVRTARFFRCGGMVAIDATGYSSSCASRHYMWRIGLGSYTKRKYVKLSISVCTDNQCIIAAKPRLGPRNDNIDFKPLVRRSFDVSDAECVIADKGYDSEAGHELVRSLGANPMIPLKRNKYGTVRKHNRRKMLLEFDAKIYNRRSLVETVNSVMKRLMGSWVNSRSVIHQRKELIGMCVVYNVHRYVSISLTCWMISTEPYYNKLFKSMYCTLQLRSS